ncbi:cytochrome P450 [Nocardia sp. alder85J]|uniref:cytochrome P450 n=1 Tax=Nocardia sp. alder85J TaxID=2862949 RepID=UPI001CD7804B|nr:cytochrome P450 [Nocardia sp. alder85J]MCX4091564.1 cytochrome P450 [Nocardia sp. alder85J]
MSADSIVFDPFAPGFAEDPYPQYRRLRELAPVHEHPLGFWIVSRHTDVAALQRSAQSVDERHLTRLPTWKSDSGTLGKRNRIMGGLSLLDQDPPDHTRLRRLVAKAFGPRAIQALQPRIEHHVHAALDRIAAAGGADVLAEFAFPLPFAVISELLGIPLLDGARLRELVGVLALALEPLPDPELQARIRAADAEVLALVGDLIAWKRAHLADDVLTSLIAAEHDGDVLDANELAAQVVLLYIAGHETTVNLLANGILALLRHPGEAHRLRTDPELAANAVEELLRYDTPVQLMRRVAVTPFVAAGAEIPAGSWVVACLGAAARDPAFWGEDADRLRLDRPDAGRHLCFGAGIHHCLGATLARLEARIAFTAFVSRFPGAELLELERNGRINVRGPARLTISV